MEQEDKIICNWCGKPATIWIRGECLCDNCWEGFKAATPVKKPGWSSNK